MTCTPYSGDQIKKSEMGGTCSTYGGEEKILMGKPEGQIPLGRPRCRWEDNIKMDLQEVRCGDVDWIALTLDRNRWRALVAAIMNLRVL